VFRFFATTTFAILLLSKGEYGCGNFEDRLLESFVKSEPAVKNCKDVRGVQWFYTEPYLAA
jgi:hypothetical protein